MSKYLDPKADLTFKRVWIGSAWRITKRIG